MHDKIRLHDANYRSRIAAVIVSEAIKNEVKNLHSGSSKPRIKVKDRDQGWLQYEGIPASSTRHPVIAYGITNKRPNPN